jgi:hypothetical protein
MPQEPSTGLPPTANLDAVSAFQSFLTPDEGETGNAEPLQDDVLEGEDAPETEAESEPAESTDDPSETDDTPDDQPPAPQTLTVKIDGKEKAVTLEEAAKGYQRQEDYTRKTQEVAEERRSLAAERQQVADHAARFAEGLKVVEQMLATPADAEPDWDELQKSDPVEFARQWAVSQRQKEKLRDVVARREEAERVAQEAQRQKFADYVKEERAKLLAAEPTWADESVARSEFTKLHAFGRSQGFTDTELNGMADSRAILVLRDAMRYAELKAAPTPTQKRAAVTTLRPTAPTTPVKTSDLTRDKQRLAKTGRPEDAAKIFMRFL